MSGVNWPNTLDCLFGTNWVVVRVDRSASVSDKNGSLITIQVVFCPLDDLLADGTMLRFVRRIKPLEKNRDMSQTFQTF